MEPYDASGDDRTPAASEPTANPPKKAPARARKSPNEVTGSNGSRPVIDPKAGLLARVAAEEVIKGGPLRFAEDGRFWTYAEGVWQPGEKEIHKRVVRVLDNAYRESHANAIRAVIRAIVPEITGEPVPEFINFRNGLLDWRNPDGPKLVPHTPDVVSTVQLAIDWSPEAQCTDFHDFMTAVLPEDDIARVWELIGYMLMSGNPLHRAFLFAGGGRNGKGAMMRTILAVLGKDNVSNVPLHDFSANRFATAQLYGRMANVCGDIDSTYIESTGRIKEITGEDAVQAEHKFGQPFRFTAWCSMLFSANSIPGSADSSTGWLDRWEVISFPNYFGDRVDRTLEPRLQAPESLQGIAVCAVAALRVLMDRGAFRTTDSGKAAKAELAAKSNPLYEWLEERTEAGAEHWTKRAMAYLDYKMWAEGDSRKPMSKATFYEKLRQVTGRGITEVKRGDDGFKGFKLKRDQLG